MRSVRTSRLQRLELRSLVHVILTRWWLVLPVFLVSMGVAVGLTVTQIPIYQATSTVVVAPSRDVQDESLSALAIIARQSEIADTYAQIASSRTIRQTAAERLQLLPEQRRDLNVSSHLVAGTTLLEIDASSPDAALAAGYANAVSEVLVEYIAANYGIFQLNILDSAVQPNRPVSPEVPLNIGLGAAGGLLLGMGLAVVSYVLNPPSVPQPIPGSSMPGRTGYADARLHGSRAAD
jgi:polysaccharide biosynthesis transport protein